MKFFSGIFIIYYQILVTTADSVCSGFDRRKRDTYEIDVYGEDAYELEYDNNDIMYVLISHF